MEIGSIVLAVIAVVLAAGLAYFIAQRATDALKSQLSDLARRLEELAKRIEAIPSQLKAVPVGTILPFGGGEAPEGYHRADGSLLDPAHDRALCDLVKDRFTLPDDPPTACRLPDLRGRVAVGAGDAGHRSDLTPGHAFGAETLTLSVDQLPAHEHALNVPVYRFHGDARTFRQSENNAVVAGCPYGPNDTGPCEGPNRHGTKVKAGSNGGGQPIPLSQPSLVIQYIIKR